MRERKRDDQSGFDEGLLALYEKLRELDETPDGHEPCVRQETHERGRENLPKDVPVQQPHGTDGKTKKDLALSSHCFPAPIRNVR